MGVHYPPELIDEILERVDMMDIMREHGVQVRPGTGENNYYIADFCCGKKDFENGRIRKSTQTYKCRSCLSGGNAIQFLRNVVGLSFHEAVVELADRVGVELPSGNEEQDPKQARKELALSLTVQFYHSQNNFDYLLSRGVSLEVLKKYKAGYAPGGRKLREYLESQGFTKQELLDYRLINSKGLDRFYYRAVIPIYMFGKVVDLYTRAINDKHAPVKHIYLYGDIPFLGGYDFLVPGKPVPIFESFIDQLVAESHGIVNGTNPGGATKFTPTHARLLRKKTSSAVVLYDGDPRGQEGALSTGAILNEKEFNVSVGELPNGQDPAQMIHEQGIEAFREGLKIVTYRQFEMFCNLKQYSLEEIELYLHEMKKEQVYAQVSD
ncbi:DNA primase [Paenibacillus polymyxa]